MQRSTLLLSEGLPTHSCMHCSRLIRRPQLRALRHLSSARLWCSAEAPGQAVASQDAATRQSADARNGNGSSASGSGAAEGVAASDAAGQSGKAGGKSGQKGQKKGGKVDTSSEEGLRALRLDKVAELRAAGKDPYAYSFQRTHTAKQLQDEFAGLGDGEYAELDQDVSAAGRVMLRRVMGKLAFFTLRDGSGDVQLYLDRSIMNEEEAESFSELKKMVDVGDFVGVTGGMKKTDRGEVSVVVKRLRILTKSLRPLPEKWHGLSDIEKRYRQRYLDMIVTPGVTDVFRMRADATQAIRNTLVQNHGYLEVETPVLEATAGGAEARPFLTHHNALGRPFALRIATELALKRLVVGGLERVFEIGRIFRNEGVSARHNPEFTTMEAYQAYADYITMLELTEELVRAAAQAATGGQQVVYQGLELDFAQPFRRATMRDLVREATGVDFRQFSGDLEAARAAGAEAVKKADAGPAAARAIAGAESAGHVLNAVFEAVVEATLQQPTFVMDHPLEISPLAKPHRSEPGAVERWELFIAGRELANSFSELTDAVDQRQRLEAQITSHSAAADAAQAAAEEKAQSGEDAAAALEAAAEEAYEVQMDEDFVAALEYGMPPTGGVGIGIDRLVMLLTDSPSIRDVIAFPLMK